MTLFDLAHRKAGIEVAERRMLAPDFWQDRQIAQRHIDRLNSQKEIVSTHERVALKIHQFLDELELLNEEYSAEMHALMDHEYRQVMHEIEEFELLILLHHEFDRLNAIVEIHPGAGGTESQDWADMLYRMYVRYADLKSFKVETVDYQVGEEAGLKSVMFVVRGSYAYGYLKAEKGVHRLVRISPFDASGRRHTSFASVDVIPEFTADTDLSINDADLRIDTYRAGGAGGQHINKTDSAVRITHLPSGIVVTSQSQRSQIQNREQAMVVLKAKLYQKKMEEKQMELDRIRGVQKSIEWGSQIRSYVFQPYTLVKDHRSNYETGDVQRVINGDLDSLIYAVLKMGVE